MSMVRACLAKFAKAFRKGRRQPARGSGLATLALQAKAEKDQGRPGHPRIRDCIQGGGEGHSDEDQPDGSDLPSPPDPGHGWAGDGGSEDLEPPARSPLDRKPGETSRRDPRQPLVAILLSILGNDTGGKRSDPGEQEPERWSLQIYFLVVFVGLLIALGVLFGIGFHLERVGSPLAGLVLLCAFLLLLVVFLLVFAAFLVIISHRFPGGRGVILVFLVLVLVLVLVLYPKLSTVLGPIARLVLSAP